MLLYFWNELRRRKGEKSIRKISDLDFIIEHYKKSTGRVPNIKHPERYTEKLQWLKLFYRDPKIEICSDKYTVRKYVEDQGYGNILNRLIGVYNNVDEVNFDELPKKFVIKASHGSGWNIVCKDKSKLNWKAYKRILNSWMKQNLYMYGREWNYNNLVPKIIIEDYIDSGDGQLTDYKFFCFDGKAKFIQVDRDRFINHKQTFYNTEWEKLEFTVANESVEQECPKNFDKMLQIAEELSKPFPHVRIDFYNVDGKIYFGEFTFFDGSGFYNYNPDNWDFYWGDKIVLPNPNYNLELLESLK